ncbi:hypothetical protein KO488_02720 [Poseidonibacter lekithochrous]|uniref:hypothetical protein n=1 Tax=Poseidonibacter TaxID=2321187 RepID=UPI001C08605D|nr:MULTISPECIES: hypothetical protein [Poseidonibacter]MBU3013656.1 hypothetical protein [Poseidonibacter lekithochrous]MDO6826953.1 hypothetical protein [Poseidonibacter sp. 1_MG-2023]
MKLFFGCISLFVLVLFTFYYINLNLEKTIAINGLINLSQNEKNIIYSAKNVEDKDDIIEFSLKKDNEVFVISGNETISDEKDEKVVTININRPHKDVILILSSKDQTKWNIIPSDTTNIKLIVYNNQNTVVSKEVIYKYKKELKLDLNVENIEFVELLKYIGKISQKDNIDYFYGSEIIDSKIQIDNIDSNSKFSLNYLNSKEPKVNFTFNLISNNYDFIPFTLQGPMNNKNILTEIKNNVTSSPDKTKIYEIIKNGLKIINTATKKEVIKLMPILGRITKPKGIAYDNLSDMVYIANRNGEFYIFDALDESWKSIRKYIDDFSINSLSYDNLSNTFLSSNWKKNGIFVFDQKGNFNTEYNLDDKLLGFNYHYKKTSPLPQLYLVPHGDDIVIVLIDKFVQKIWLFNKLERKAILTYNYMD